MFRRVTASIVVFLLLLLLVPSLFAAAPGQLVWDNPGSIHLDKTATAVSNNEFAFKIDLKIEGKDINATHTNAENIVLVIDRSTSMETNGRLTSAKAAATSLVNILLATESSKVNIAFVHFGHDVQTDGVFYNYSSKATLLAKINALKLDGATSIQAAIYTARKLIEDETNGKNNGTIILLTDGMPNYSYTPTAIVDNPGFHGFSFRVTAFDYSGSISGPVNYTVDSKTVSHELTSLSEAQFAKDADIDIYSISLDGTTAVNKVVKGIASDSTKVIHATSADLKSEFQKIATKISYAANAGVVTDYMGSITVNGRSITTFRPVFDGTLPMPVVSQGSNPVWDETTLSFTWAVGTVSESAPATFTYYVVATQELLDAINKGEVDPDVVTFPAGGGSKFDYADVDGDNDSKNFPVPWVVIPNTRGLILIIFYEVNADGKLVGPSGNVLIDSEQANFALAREVYRTYAINNDDVGLKGSKLFYRGSTYSVTRPDVGTPGFVPFGSSTKSITTVESETKAYFASLASNEVFRITFIAGDHGSLEATNSTATTLVKQVQVDLLVGTTIVAPKPVPDVGYIFTGWTPVIPAYAKANGTYTANFAVDPNYNPGGNNNPNDIPRTSDGNLLLLPIGTILVSICTIAIIAKKRKITSL